MGLETQKCATALGVDPNRLVGDPVDLVTGALMDVETDFKLVGPLDFRWMRYYDSRRDEDVGLGVAQRHAYSAELLFDLDGLTVVLDNGNRVEFGFLLADGDSESDSGYTLQRVTERQYLLIPDACGPARRFEAADPLRARLVSCEGRKGRIDLQYDREGRLATCRLDAGRSVRLERDGHGRLAALHLHDPRDGSLHVLMRYHYDAVGRLVRAEHMEGPVSTLKYHGGGQHVAEKRLFTGYRFLYEFDAQGRCVRTRGEDGVHDNRLAYHPLERMTEVTRHDDGVWQYFYDEQSSVTNIIDPYGDQQVFEFDGEGRLVRETDELGNVTTLFYDEDDELVLRKDERGNVLIMPEGKPAPASRGFEPRAPQDFEHGKAAQVVERLPDEQGLPAWVPSVARQVLVTSRDSREGSSIPVPDALGRATQDYSFEHPPRQRGHNPAGFTSWVRDHDGHVERYTYSSWNFRTGVTRPNGEHTRYEYTPTEELAAVVDAAGNRSEFERDLKGRVVGVHRHGKLRERYTLDAGGNQLEKLDGDGHVLVQRSFQPGNLESSRKLASGGQWSFTYDDRGRLRTAESAELSQQFRHNAFGHRSVDKLDGKGVEHEFQLHEPRTTFVLDRFVTGYERDASGHRVVVHDPTGGKHVVRSTDTGLVQRAFANGVSEVAQYDLRGAARSKTAYRRRDDRLLRSRRFEYSGEGDLLRVEDSERGATVFEHDACHRLRRAVLPDGTEQHYAYDAAANLTRAPGLEAGYQGTQLWSANGDRFHFNGRDHVCERVRQSDGSRTRFEYDSEDQLTRIEAPDYTYEASYDCHGRRISKKVNGEQTRFYWDGSRLAAEVSHDGSLRVYVYVDHEARVPMLFVDYESVEADPRDGKVYSLLTNHQGTPEQVLDDRGEVVWRARLDPYGTAHVEVGEGFHQPLRMPGHYFDAETGLHDNRYRVYSPELGRYLQSDPKGVGGGLNTYAYTENPLRQVDLHGLECCPDVEAERADVERRLEDLKGQRRKLGDMSPAQKKQHAKDTARAMNDLHMVHKKELCSKKKHDDPDKAPRDGDTFCAMVVSTGTGKNKRHKVVITSNLPNKEGPPRHMRKAADDPESGVEYRNDGPHLKKGKDGDPEGGYYDENGDEYYKSNARNRRRTADGDLPADTELRSDHHAEQRALRAKRDDETIEAISPSRKCCPGCDKALEDAGQIDNVPEDMQDRAGRAARREAAEGLDDVD